MANPKIIFVANLLDVMANECLILLPAIMYNFPKFPAYKAIIGSLRIS